MKEKTYYIYGMRLRGFAPGCQPMNGFVRRLNGACGYFDFLVYDRKLTAKELADYELDYDDAIPESVYNDLYGRR